MKLSHAKKESVPEENIAVDSLEFAYAQTSRAPATCAWPGKPRNRVLAKNLSPTEESAKGTAKRRDIRYSAGEGELSFSCGVFWFAPKFFGVEKAGGSQA